ncbi:unnamed protein product [Zymoseptoria tritici ST99CH_3D7]|nr:unnamed protein product [Zymoseptoria tritici ST99CH_3D7]
MSRGGRGGGAAGRMKDLPFEVDTALEDQITAYTDGLNEDDEKILYPDMKIHHAPPPTARERKLVNKWREIREARRNGPFFIDAPRTGKRDPAEFNAFEDVDSYSSKRVKRTGGLHSLKNVGIVKELLPEELWSVVDDGEEVVEGAAAPKKNNLAFLKKRRLDKLARFDDGAEVDLTADINDDDEDKNADDEGADAPEALEDDDFTEDDDDLGDDYNAEKYFSGGENNEDDGGGDDGGGEEPW